jgi:hypothetical protein
VGQLRNSLESLPGWFSPLSLGALDGQLGKCVTDSAEALKFVNFLQSISKTLYSDSRAGKSGSS